jgi:hypothetical protein
LHCGTAEKPCRAKLVLSAVGLQRVHQRGTGRLPVAGQGRQGHLAAGSCGATSAPGAGPVFPGAARSPVRNETLSVGEKPGVQPIANTAPDWPPVAAKHPGFSRGLEYTRLGKSSILAAPDLHDGRVTPRLERRHHSREFTDSPESRGSMWRRSPTMEETRAVVPCCPGDYLLKLYTIAPQGLSISLSFVFPDRAPMKADSVEWAPHQARP